MKKIFHSVMAVMLLSIVLIGCGTAKSDIVVLYTNDVHCGISDDIGYAGLAAYRDDISKKSPQCVLVDVGDFIQGDVIGAVSKGELIVDLLNAVGYKYAVLGNHEFDYGMPQLKKLLGRLNAQVLSCNLTYTGSGDNPIESIIPSDIVTFGETKVAFIGVTTPWSVTTSNPANFYEGGNIVYDFCAGDDGKRLYDAVQNAVNDVRSQGANFVILITHLGDLDEMVPYSSVNVANNTDGIDAILDGHSHSVLPCLLTKNKVGKDVIISSTGMKLDNIGQLTITANGKISTKLIPSYKKKNPKVQELIDQIQGQLAEKLDVVVAQSNVDLPNCNSDGIRLVRNRETAIGNMCADAFRVIGQADIGIINGGGIRTGLKSGNITYRDVIAIFPFGNTLTVKEVTGQQILDALECSYRTIVASVGENGNAAGENGGFFQISGLKCVVDTNVVSPVVTDSNGNMIGISDGDRRISDVAVLGADGEYSPIDPSKTYTVASIGFILNSAGDGNTAFNGGKTIIDGGIADNDLLITYIQDVLHGDLATKYSNVEGRITVK